MREAGRGHALNKRSGLDESLFEAQNLLDSTQRRVYIFPSVCQVLRIAFFAEVSSSGSRETTLTFARKSLITKDFFDGSKVPAKIGGEAGECRGMHWNSDLALTS